MAEAQAAEPKPKAGRRGRPKGSKNDPTKAKPEGKTFKKVTVAGFTKLLKQIDKRVDAYRAKLLKELRSQVLKDLKKLS